MSTSSRWLRLLAALALLYGLFGRGAARPAEAQVITVTSTAEAPGAAGDCTLGEAIQAANSNTAVDLCPAGTSSDVIALQPGATYDFQNGVADPVHGPSAHVVSSTITLQGNGAVLSHLPLAGSLRFFAVVSPGNLTLVNLTLRGGRARGADGLDSIMMTLDGGAGRTGLGGAIRTEVGTTLALDGVTFSDNVAQGGTGGRGYPPGPSLGGPGGDGLGGAVYALATLEVVGGGASFVDNRAIGGTGGLSGNLNMPGGAGGDGTGGALYLISPGPLPLGPITATGNVAQGGTSAGAMALGPGGLAWGGVATVIGSFVSIDRAYFYDNRAEGGSADSPAGGSAQGGSAYGGALYVLNGLDLSHSTLIRNTAQGGNGPGGGFAGGGGLILDTGGSSTYQVLTDTVLLSNTAQGGQASVAGQFAGTAVGGGVYARKSNLSAAGLAAVGNVSLGGRNTAVPLSIAAPSLGGGLYVSDGAASLTNFTLAHNLSRSGGGLAAEAISGDLNLTHGTVYSNTAATGSGVFLEMDTFVRNSLLAHNADDDNCAVAGPLVMLGDNLQFPGTACGSAAVADPLLGALGDHGGRTLTVELLPGSPAIDQADPAFCPAVDQRGHPRPVGDDCDLGALERGGWLFLPLMQR